MGGMEARPCITPASAAAGPVRPVAGGDSTGGGDSWAADCGLAGSAGGGGAGDAAAAVSSACSMSI